MRFELSGDMLLAMIKRSIPFSRILVFFAGIAGLAISAPGFRPKEIRDLALRFAVAGRADGFLLGLAMIGLLIPAAARLRKAGFSRTFMGALMILISSLLCVDIFGELVLGQYAIARWILRAAYGAIVVWGFCGRAAACEAFGAAGAKAKHLWKGLGEGWLGFFTKLLLVLVMFFLVREQLHHFLTRGSQPFGDEISWWFTGAEKMMHQGLRVTMLEHGYGFYTPGIPWLISLPGRLVNSHQPTWLLAFAMLVMVLYYGFLFEAAASGEGFLGGVCALFLTFMLSRDFHFNYTASLYGGNLAALITAVLLLELYRHFTSESAIGFRQGLRLAAGAGLFLGWARLTKPPIAFLSWYFTLALCAVLAWKMKNFSRMLKFMRKPGGHEHRMCECRTARRALLAYIGVLLAGAVIPYEIWRHELAALGRKPEYSVKLSQILETGLDLRVPWHMLLGLANAGSPQRAFTTGLILAFAIAALKRARGALMLMGATVFVYWGFVFGLYATLWQRGDYSSAGRYLSHAAIACLLILPLAFKPYSSTR